MDVCPGLHSLKKPTLFCASNSVRLSARERSIWSLSITWVVTVDFRCCSSRPEAVTISVSLSGSYFAVFSAPAENCEYDRISETSASFLLFIFIVKNSFLYNA